MTRDRRMEEKMEDDYRCNHFDGKVGYQGQSHEILAERDGKTTRLGWQNGTDLTAWQPIAKAWRLENLRASEVQR